MCHGSRDIIISGFDSHIAIFGYRSLSQSLGDTFIELAMIENAGFSVGILTLFVTVADI